MRTNKRKLLLDEELSYIYKNNQCEGVTCRWQYKISNNLYVECKLDLFYDVSKKVSILIELNTGVVLVKGSCYKEFCDKYFSEMVKTGKDTNVISTTNIQETNIFNQPEYSEESNVNEVVELMEGNDNADTLVTRNNLEFTPPEEPV